MERRLKTLSTKELIQIFQSKARCSHTQNKASSALAVLKDRLSEYEYGCLSSAWGHCFLGPAELDRICGALLGKVELFPYEMKKISVYK